MHTTVTFHNTIDLDSYPADRHDGHRVTVLDYIKGDESGTTLEVGCHDCGAYGDPSIFAAYPAELMLTTDRMPCSYFEHVGDDDEDGPYSRCGTHPWESELMGTPEILDAMGWCEGWGEIPYPERELMAALTPIHFPTTKEN